MGIAQGGDASKSWMEISRHTKEHENNDAIAKTNSNESLRLWRLFLSYIVSWSHYCHHFENIQSGTQRLFGTESTLFIHLKTLLISIHL